MGTTPVAADAMIVHRCVVGLCASKMAMFHTWLGLDPDWVSKQKKRQKQMYALREKVRL